MLYFTADEHYGHRNILIYCNRPFETIEEHDNELINNHNDVVTDRDVVIHAGDFTLGKIDVAKRYIKRLNGYHIFLRGSHDHWLSSDNDYIWEKDLKKEIGAYVVVCHYAMRTWARSHYNSYQLYGHSHGKLEPIGKQWDIGVDNNNYYPVSLDDIAKIMSLRPDNSNFIGRKQL